MALKGHSISASLARSNSARRAREQVMLIILGRYVVLVWRILTKQLAFRPQRLADIDKLTGELALSAFRAQDTQVQYETVA